MDALTRPWDMALTETVTVAARAVGAAYVWWGIMAGCLSSESECEREATATSTEWLRAKLPSLRAESGAGTRHLRVLTQANVTIFALRGTAEAMDWALNMAFAHGVQAVPRGVAADVAAVLHHRQRTGAGHQFLVAGHSQGGYRALHVAKAVGLRAVVFNALTLGLHSSFQPGQVVHVRMQHDVVSHLGGPMVRAFGLCEITVPQDCDMGRLQCLAAAHRMDNFYDNRGVQAANDWLNGRSVVWGGVPKTWRHCAWELSPGQMPPSQSPAPPSPSPRSPSPSSPPTPSPPSPSHPPPGDEPSGEPER